MSLYQCPCCDYFSLDDRGEYSICSVCFWEDSGWDVDCPDKYSGPNHMTLREGRRNFRPLAWRLPRHRASCCVGPLLF